MRKRSKNAILFGMMAMLSCLVVILAVSVAAPVFAASLFLDETSFTVTYDGHQYLCHRLKDSAGEDGNPVEGIAIAWGENPEDTPSSLNIPNTFTYSDVAYTIRAISPGGFRYCDFASITLPQTVEVIKEEAFAYCENLTSFQIPKLVDKIAPSTFMDCRSLESIYFSAENGTRSYANNTITEIGDHAFDSCVSLRMFICPSSLTYFGESCFQKCSNIMNFFFPSKITSNNVITNPITVRPYAFADCSSMIFIYFEDNMSEIDDYAFVGAHSSCRIKYVGTKDPSFKRDGVSQSHWRNFYITTGDNKNIPIDKQHPYIHLDTDYPCFRYTVENTAVLLDSSKTGYKTIEVIDSTEAAEGYAVIYKFETPSDDLPGCFTIANGTLTIPDTLGGHKVKVIRESAFANNNDIKNIIFNESLVQICQKAFLNCMNIESINFDLCENLKEVSSQVFYDVNTAEKNTKVTSLILPDCLEYIGDSAFANFSKVKNFHLSQNVKAIADLAFYYLGFSISDSEATVDIVLPKTLNDESAAAAHFTHYRLNSYSHSDETRWFAVGKYAFNYAHCIRSVTMEDDPDHENDMDYTCSFFSNALKDCTNLIRFKASANAGYIGKDIFKNCSKLREVFFTTEKANDIGDDFVWGIDEENGNYGGTLFFGVLSEIVVFVDGSQAPGVMDSYSLTADPSQTQIAFTWNSESGNAYTDSIAEDSTTGNGLLSRSHVPTFYNVDFVEDIKYWNPKTKSMVNTAPVTLDDYNNGIVSLVKEEDNSYTVARYYFASGKATDIIDLTKIPGISDASTHLLKKLGDECFAKNESNKEANGTKDKQPGCYFIFPDTLEVISERALYRKTPLSMNKDDDDVRKANARYGVRIATYRLSSNQKILDSDGTTQISDSDFASRIATLEAPVDISKRGWCVLPPSLTYLGRLSFHNNIFQTIVLGSNITYFGRSAFTASSSSGNFSRATLSSISFAGNSIFSYEANGIYYIGGGNDKKMLVFQIQDDSNSTLTIASNTKAIANGACTHTNYTTINLASSVMTVYGLAFTWNRKLTTVNNTSNLRYISAMENVKGDNTGWSDDGYTEVFDDSVAEHIDNADFHDVGMSWRPTTQSLFGSFRYCYSLTTFNLRDMTEIRKIGWRAFDNCTALENMTGTQTYTYKEYSKSSGSLNAVSNGTNTSKGVLDLSQCTNLRSISQAAFTNCNKVKFVHLPNNKNSTGTESALYMGRDPEAAIWSVGTGAIFSNSKGIRVLVGESAEYANQDFGKGHNASTHYPANVFGTGNTIYYYAASVADIPSTDSSALKYWTKDGSGNYIFLNSAVDARAYFA